MSFRKRLQALIDKENISQADLAAALGVNQARVSDWLSGKTRNPHRKTIVNIAEYFGCDPDWLQHGIGEAFSKYSPKYNDFRMATIGRANTTVTGDIHQRQSAEGEDLKWSRAYRDTAAPEVVEILDAIARWVEESGRYRKTFPGWFVHEFSVRFPEFDTWLQGQGRADGAQ